MVDEPAELAHGDAEESGGAGHVVASRHYEVECLGEEARVILVLGVDGHLVALATALPEVAALVRVA